MIVELVTEYAFESAHLLPHVPPGHKCARLHGHSFKLHVHVKGPVDERTGWLMDFAALDEIVEPVLATVDHHYLNEIPGLENPTSEVLARWLWRALKPKLAPLVALTVCETHDARCIYRGEEE